MNREANILDEKELNIGTNLDIFPSIQEGFISIRNFTALHKFVI